MCKRSSTWCILKLRNSNLHGYLATVFLLGSTRVSQDNPWVRWGAYHHTLTTHAPHIREIRRSTCLHPSVAVQGRDQRKEKAFIYEGCGGLQMVAWIKYFFYSMVKWLPCNSRLTTAWNWNIQTKPKPKGVCGFGCTVQTVINTHAKIAMDH